MPNNPNQSTRFQIHYNVQVILGNRVFLWIIEEEFYNSGTYNFLWEAEHLSSGIYFISLQAEVDHLPPGLVAPAGIISGMGYSMTKLFETLFASPMPGYLPYYKYGTTFASQVRADMRDMRIQDPVVAENMESFINNCVNEFTSI